MKNIRILLVEDNRLLRDGIVAIINKHSDMHLVAAQGNWENVSAKMDKVKPDIMLLDLVLRNQNSLQIVKLSKDNFPETKIIVMDLIPYQVNVFEFVEAGVSGFLLKDAGISDFLKTIRLVHKGHQVLPPHLTDSLFSQIIGSAIDGLNHAAAEESIRMTKREQQIIQLIAEGDTNKEIALKLHLSIHTIKSHVHNILEKLALNTRVQIAKYARLSKS
jgi:DNA-binding NarL/FixJ family response regulator